MGALNSGVTGLQAHQQMLDVTGNNLANVNTTAYKSSRINFSELLSETVKKASQPTSSVGGTNSQQVGTGVAVSGFTYNMNQGDIVSTGNPLDMAIEGEGYFVLYDGEKNVYTRAGIFSVDASYNLVDASTGYIVQRIGTAGEADGFQASGDSNIKVPYDVGMPAQETTSIVLAGNLSSDATATTTATNILTSSLRYTVDNTAPQLTTAIGSLDQFSGGSGTGGAMGASQSGTITISGIDPDGTALSSGLTFAVTATTTIGNFIDHLNNNVLGGDATASLVNGEIVITDTESGYSKSDLVFTYAGDGELETPSYFEISTVGGEEVKSLNITVYDTQGEAHVLTAALVRTETDNTWDLLLTSITGDISSLDFDERRIEGIEFSADDGSLIGLDEAIGDTAELTISFAHNPAVPQTISLSLGTSGQFDGLTQFAGSSTAVATEQDGYEAGSLSTVSVNSEGTLIGAYSNGIKKELATLQIALFQNAAGLERVGDNYFIPSANSGEAVATQAITSGAGTVHGGSLESSNADVATEFVNLIQAQNGYQANARTITVANEILQELTNLIR